MKNLTLAASAAAALTAVVALSSIDYSPSPVAVSGTATGSPTAFVVGAAAGSARSATSQAVPKTDAEIQAAVADWLPGKVSPVSAVARGAGSVPTVTPSASGTNEHHRVSARPVIPDHPVAMPDEAPFKPGALASGTNPTNATVGSDLSAAGPAGVALSNTFTLASRPSSTHTLFLDPRGATVTNRLWNTAAGYNTPALAVAAYTHGDTDPEFDADDLTQLQIIWQEVSADYAPFDINVTLDPPSDLANTIGRSDSADDTFGTQVMITSTPDPHHMGGVAWLGGSAAYSGSNDPMYQQPAFVWGGAGDTGHNAAQAAAHEAGHTWGLVHESGASTYYTGSTTWAPIMGASYYAAMGQWSMGEFKGAKLNVTVGGKGAHQDEVGTIRSVIGSADDDNGPDADATVLSGSSATGTIESNADVDSFALSSTGGDEVSVVPTADITDLDLSLDVVDVTAGKVLTSGLDPSLSIAASAGYGTATGGLDASFYLPATATAHTYLINVAGGGNGASPATDVTAYSAYGSLGTYGLSVTSASAPGSTSGGDDFSLDGISVLTRTPGVPITFDVDYNPGDVDPSGVLWAWKASKSSCKFSDATSTDPTLTCLATDTGAVTVTATATASGYPTQTRTASFALATTPQVAPTLALSVAGQTSATAQVCATNKAVVLGTVIDTYGRPVYGASVRLYTNGVAKTVKSDLNGHVMTTTSATATSYALDSLASGVFPAQAAKLSRDVQTSTANCFGDGTEVQVTPGNVVVIPGLTSTLTAKVVAADGRPVTGVPVVFTDTPSGATAASNLGTATTDVTGTATYLLKGSAAIKAGTLKATVAKSTAVTTALSAEIGGISVASGGITADFDTSSFNINGATSFAQDGYREDKLITNVTSTVAGRVTAGYGATSIPAAAIPVTLAVTYPNPKGGADLVKKIAGKTDANGWFRIPVKNPVATGVAGAVSISAAKSGLFPAIPAEPFDDSAGTQAIFETKLMNVSVVPSATTVAIGNVVTFTATAANPWPNGSARALTAPDVTFKLSMSNGYYPSLKTKGGTFSMFIGAGSALGTWTAIPATSTAYTALTTSFSVQ